MFVLVFVGLVLICPLWPVPSPVFLSKLSAEVWPSYWTLAARHMSKEEVMVSSTRTCWSLPLGGLLTSQANFTLPWYLQCLESYSEHKQKVRERNREREGAILERKYSSTASVSLGCGIWPWRPAAHFGHFIHSPHFNTWCKGNTHKNKV